MTDRIALFDHTIVVDRISLTKYRAQVWRATFDERGVIHGCIVIGELTARTKAITVFRARSMIRQARKRGARWPRPYEP